MPCFVLRSMSLHAYMFRSTCLGFYAMFLLFRSSLCFALMLGLYAHMLDTMSMVMLCSDLYVYALLPRFMPRSTFVHGYMLGSIFYHVYVLVFYMFACTFVCLYVQIYAIFVCLDLGYVCLAMCYCSPFVDLPFFLVFQPVGLDPIQTLCSLSSSINFGLYQRVWITPIYMSMLAYFYAL